AAAQAPGTDDRPTQLPPLLPVPPNTTPTLPTAPGPRVPSVEYDPGYFYLPERAPEIVQVVPDAPRYRWWVAPSAPLAWVSSHPAPQALRLRPPDLFGGTVQGLNIPLGGRTADPFQVGFGLTVGRWFGDEQRRAMEASFFVLPGATRTLDGFAPGTLVVFPDGPAHSAPMFFRLPGVASTFPATASTWFAGAELNYRAGLLATEDARLDLLAGYRFAYLEDELYLGEQPADGQTLFKRNRLTAEDTFHGGQLGLAGEWRTQTWYTEGAVKV